MFGRRKPTFPAFIHPDDCKILKADPGVRSNGRSMGIGWRSAFAARSTTTNRPVSAEFGSTRGTRRTCATCRSASIGTPPIPPSFEPS